MLKVKNEKFYQLRKKQGRLSHNFANMIKNQLMIQGDVYASDNVNLISTNVKSLLNFVIQIIIT